MCPTSEGKPTFSVTAWQRPEPYVQRPAFADWLQRPLAGSPARPEVAAVFVLAAVLIQRVHARIGYVPIYVGLVSEERQVARVPHYREYRPAGESP